MADKTTQTTVSNTVIHAGRLTGHVPYQHAMAELGYKDRKVFLGMAKRTGLPLVRVSRKCILCDIVALRAWLESQRVAGRTEVAS